MNQQGIASVFDAYHKALKEVDVSVFNAMYDTISNAERTSFCDGWVAGALWVMDQNDDYSVDADAMVEARDKQMNKRYPII